MDFILLIVAIIPIILLAKYIYQKDRNKEPNLLLFKFFLLGISSVLIVFFLSSILGLCIPLMNKDTTAMNEKELFIYVFILVAFIEEGCKWVMTYFLGYHHKEFDEFYDIIVYATFVSLGFAFYENLIYVFLHKEIIVGIYRGLMAIPGHISFAIFMGYFLGLAKRSEKKGNKKQACVYKIDSIVIPIILHGIYDFCCLSNNNLFIIFFFLFTINLSILSYKKIKEITNTPIPLQ